MFEEHKRSRLSFKLALRYCRRHEEQIRCDKMAESLQNGSCKDFWREVKRKKDMHAPLPNTINNASDGHEICEMYVVCSKPFFGNSVPKNGLEEMLQSITVDDTMTITSSQLP